MKGQCFGNGQRLIINNWQTKQCKIFPERLPSCAIVDQGKMWPAAAYWLWWVKLVFSLGSQHELWYGLAHFLEYLPTCSKKAYFSCKLVSLFRWKLDCRKSACLQASLELLWICHYINSPIYKDFHTTIIKTTHIDFSFSLAQSCETFVNLYHLIALIQSPTTFPYKNIPHKSHRKY